MIRFSRSARKLFTIGLSAICTLMLLSGMAWLFRFQLVAAADAAPFTVGLITDGPTMDDHGFSWSAYQGLVRAQNELGVVGTVYTSPNPSHYAPNLQKCVDDGNDLCISVGFLTTDAMEGVAAANPGTYFATVDVAFDSYANNLRGITFASDEVGYLAGTLAGLMTESHVVGTIGGMPIPAVDLFLNGYRNGARCANPSVNVLVSYTNSFSDPELGAQAAQAMIAQGADVIFPAAGGTGNGALLAATQAGFWGIGVDTDQYVTLFEDGTVSGADKVLSSAMKRIDHAVFATINDVVAGAFTSGTVLYDLAAEGVGLAPFHDAASSVPQSVQDELESVSLGIVNGTIDVTAPCPSKVFLPFIIKLDAPPAAAPVLNPIDNPGGNYQYTVSWSPVERATSYTLQEDDNAAFSSPANVYVGSGTSQVVSAASTGTYYYRVKATNASGESGWSNTRSVVVTVSRPPCPQTGTWAGSGNRFEVDFNVSWDGSTCRVDTIFHSLSILCSLPDGGSWWYHVIGTPLLNATVANDQFTTKDVHLQTTVTGAFGSPTAITGTWSHYHLNPSNMAQCRGSGSWTGSLAP